MICSFCYEPLEGQVRHASAKTFNILLCRGCQAPRHDTLHRELYYIDSDVKLYDQIQVDEFIITRYFQPTQIGGRANYCKLYKDCIGVIDNDPHATPLGRFAPICELDHIVELPTYDLAVLKKKLKLWTTFS